MERLGELLVAAGACDPRDVARALANQKVHGSRLGTNLLLARAVREPQLADALGRLYGTPCFHGDLDSDAGLLRLIKPDLVDRYDIVPYALAREELTVLVCNPLDLRLMDEIAFATGRRIRPLAIPEARLWALMSKLYGIDRGIVSAGDRLVAVRRPGKQSVSSDVNWRGAPPGNALIRPLGRDWLKQPLRAPEADGHQPTTRVVPLGPEPRTPERPFERDGGSRTTKYRSFLEQLVKHPFYDAQTGLVAGIGERLVDAPPAADEPAEDVHRPDEVRRRGRAR